MTIKKLSVLVTACLSLLILLTVLSYWGYVAYGYCTWTGGFLTEQDKIRQAIAQINQKPSFVIDKNGRTIGYKRIPYESVDDFITRNPNCCSLMAANYFENLMNKIGGSASSLIMINYKNFYRDDDGAVIAKDIHMINIVDSCGHLYHGFD